jgi:hypothetical protein
MRAVNPVEMRMRRLKNHEYGSREINPPKAGLFSNLMGLLAQKAIKIPARLIKAAVVAAPLRINKPAIMTIKPVIHKISAGRMPPRLISGTGIIQIAPNYD